MAMACCCNHRIRTARGDCGERTQDRRRRNRDDGDGNHQFD